MEDAFNLCYRYRDSKLFVTEISCEGADTSSCCYQDRIYTFTDTTLTTDTYCQQKWIRCLENPSAIKNTQALSDVEKIWLIILCMLIFFAILIIIYFVFRLLKLKKKRESETQVESKSLGPEQGEIIINVAQEKSDQDNLVQAAQIFVTKGSARPLTQHSNPVQLKDKLSEIIRAKDEAKLATFLETVHEFYSDRIGDETVDNAKGILDAWRYERELKDYCSVADLSESELQKFQRTMSFVEGFLYKSHIHAATIAHAKDKLSTALQKQATVKDIKVRITTAIANDNLEDLETIVDLIRAKQLDKECEKELIFAQNVFEKNCKNAKTLVERDLTSAMGRRETVALRRAIKRAEMSEYKSELGKNLDAAKQVMEELEEIEKFKSLHRLKVANALKSGDVARMEQALQNVKMDGFGEDLKTDIENLEMALKRAYLKKRLKGHMNIAMQNLDLVKLRRAVNEATAAGFLNELGLELEQAQGLLSKLERIELIKKAVLELTNAHIAEIKSYTAPPIQVHKVLMSLLIVLGEEPEVVRDWFEIQVILVKTGKLSLKRRVEDYNPASLTVSSARRAAKLLNDIDSEELHTISRAAKVFYLWTSTVVEDRLAMDLILQ